MSIQAVIVEDEDLAADKLERLLRSVDPGVHVVQRLDSVDAAVAFLSRHVVDLIFLDIHLADGSGFEIFRRCKVEHPVIFTTAYDRYAIAAFKQHSIDYLLKPLDEAELAAALRKFRTHYAAPAAPAAGYAALAQLDGAGRPAVKKRFMVYTGSRMVSVETERIACFYCLEKNVFLHTRDGQHYALAYTLEKLEQLLPAETFFRVNRQIIVGIGAIKEAHAYSKTRLKLFLEPAPAFEVLVPVERIGPFKRWFGI